MLYIRLALAVVLFAVASVAGADQADAQNKDVYVSAAGVDNPDCSPSRPCNSLLQAATLEDQTHATIFVLGPYRMQTFTSSFPQSFVGQGAVSAKTLNLTIPAGENVLIEGVHFLGGAPSGLVLDGAGKVTIRDCVFDDYFGAAIDLKGPAGARVVLENVVVKNSAVGLRVKGANGAANLAFVQKSLIDGNTTSAIVIDGAANTLVISDSTLSGSGQPDLSLLNGGKAISYRSNVIRSGTPTQSLPEN